MRQGKRILITGIVLLCFFPNITKANILVMNGLTHEHQTVQGEVKTGSIELKNVAEESQSVQLYQRDYWYSHEGENRHDQPGTLERSNAGWITINPTFITLEPGGTATVEYEITVPSIDSLTGTYWSVIMVEGLQPPDTSAAEGIKINTVIRYAVQMITHISTSGTVNLSFLRFNLSRQENRTELSVAMENIGQRLVKPEVSVEIFDADGSSLGVTAAESRRLYPGTSANFFLDLSHLKSGSYTGILIADCGDDYVFGSNLTLDIKDD
jgi:hypothetical protein